MVADALELLHLVLKLVSLSKLVAIKPLDGAINCVLNLLLVSCVEIGGDLLILNGVAHVVSIDA